MNNHSRHGWICPLCNAVMSPTVPTCFYCKPNKKEGEFQSLSLQELKLDAWGESLKNVCKPPIVSKLVPE